MNLRNNDLNLIFLREIKLNFQKKIKFFSEFKKINRFNKN